MKYFILLFTLLFHTLVYSQLNTSNRTVNQKLNFKAGANFNSLTASTILTLDGSKDLASSSVTTADFAFIDNLLSLDTNGDGIVQFVDSTDSFTASKVISGTEGIVLPSGTTAQRDGTPTAGEIRYNTDTNTFEGYSNAWGAIGGGGGGGLDIFYNQDHETDVDSSDYTTGLNATFDNGGTLGGALANETTNPIAGATSIKYTTSATATNSTNDWIASASITLDDKQKGNFVGFNFFYTWDGSDDLLCVIVWDDTNDTVLNDSTDCLETASNPTRYSLGVFIPTSTNAIKLGFHHTGASESSKVLVFDDLELSSNPFVYKNLVEKGFVHYDTHAGFGSTNTVIPYFTNETSNNNISKFGTVVNDSALGFSFTANRRLKVTAVYSFNSGVNGTGGFSLNGVPTTGITALSTNQRVGLGALSNASTSGTATASVIMESGDVLRPHTDSFAAANTSRHFVTILAEAEAEHVVTPAKAGTEYYLTTGGIQTSNFWDSTGSISTFDVSLTPLTGSSLVEWDDTTQTRLVAKKDIVVDVTVFGEVATGNAVIIYNSSGEKLGQNTEDGNTYQVDTSAEVKLNKDDYIYFNVSNASGRTGGINITARPAEVQFLAAVPVQQTCFLRDVKATATNAGTSTSNTLHTRTLNTKDGDCSWVTLGNGTTGTGGTANQFTLSSGKYEIEASAPSMDAGATKIYLYNVSDSSLTISGKSGWRTAGEDTHHYSTLQGNAEITSSKTFEIKHWINAGKPGNGLGYSGGATNASDIEVNEIYTEVKITKIK